MAKRGRTGKRKPKAGKGAAKPKGRKPSYDSGIRMSRLLLGLVDRPIGWDRQAARKDLGISEKTMGRYLEAWRARFTDRFGRPIVEIREYDERALLRLVDDKKRPDPTPYEVLYLYFVTQALQCLEGTVLREGVDGLWKKLADKVPHGTLRHVEKKLFSVAARPKKYRGLDDRLDVILQALFREERLEIRYRKLSEEEDTHDLEPYTLAHHRGGLYLVGRSLTRKAIRWLAVERILEVDKVRDEKGKPVRFTYPRDYDPARYTDGMFGVIDDRRPTDVEILIHNATTESLLRARHIHKSERYTKRRDGKTVLSLRVSGLDEVRNWILGHGPWLEVLKPKALRDEIAALHAEAARLHRS